MLQVAHAGSFRGAMKKNSVGYRRLKQRIDGLESRLGFTLFHRTGDGIVLTPEGKIVIEQAQQFSDIAVSLLRLGKGLSPRQEGVVVVTATEGLGTFWVAPRLREFSRIHPNLTVRLHPTMTVADMSRYDVDVALQVLAPVRPEIKRTRIATLHMVLTAAPAYIERYGMPRTVDELNAHRFVFHTNPQFSDKTIVENALGRKLDHDQFIVMRNSSAHYMTVEHGEGIGFIPSYGFAVGAKTLPLDLPLSHSFDVWLCFHKESRSIPRVSAAIDWLIAIFDPRLYPWFRREFVPPKRFDRLISDQGIKELITPYMFDR